MTERGEVIIRLGRPGHGIGSRTRRRTATTGHHWSEAMA
jgi:hypothetical protein